MGSALALTRFPGTPQRPTGILLTILVGAFSAGCAGDELRGRCATGYEFVNNQCVLICDEGFRPENDACVAICSEPLVWTEGACLCPEGLESVGEQCLEPCASGEERVGDQCLALCPEGEERVGTDCLPLCKDGYVRDSAGDCVLDCPEGYKAVGDVCELDCPANYEAQGDACVLVCEPGEVAVEDTCVVPGAISGAICDMASGTWIAELTVSITLNSGELLTTTTDGAGAFRLDDVPPGTYYVSFEGPTYSNDMAAKVEPGEETIIGWTECLPPPGHLRGAVCDETTGLWVSNAVVTLDDEANSSITTDQFGMFIFMSVLPGDYEVRINYPNGDSETRNATVVSGQITDIGPSICEPPPDPCLDSEPVANAGADQNTVPNATVTLDGGASYAPSGGGLTYQWRVASRPTGSTANLSNPGGQITNLLADVAGDFQVCLQVTDVNGCQSQEDCMFVHVAPLVDLHIELVWMKDDSDVDLHYRRPGANWFGTGDVHWSTSGLTEDWPPAGPAGNPKLDVDNVKGYGPENINVDTLADGGPFTIGVHYWGDGRAGAVDARVRVYANGTLQFEATRTLQYCDDMWTVGEVTVSGNGTAVSVQPINTVQHLINFGYACW